MIVGKLKGFEQNVGMSVTACEDTAFDDFLGAASDETGTFLNIPWRPLGPLFAHMGAPGRTIVSFLASWFDARF